MAARKFPKVNLNTVVIVAAIAIAGYVIYQKISSTGATVTANVLGPTQNQGPGY